MNYLSEWSSSCFALCTMSIAALSLLSNEHCSCIRPQPYSLIFHSSCGYFGHTRDVQDQDVQSLLALSKGVLRKPPGLSRKQPSPPFRASAIYCLLSRQGVGSHDVDTTVKMTPRRLALHSFMMKSCATIPPHMCFSNI